MEKFRSSTINNKEYIPDTIIEDTYTCKPSSVKSKKGLTTKQERGTFKSIFGNVIGK